MSEMLLALGYVLAVAVALYLILGFMFSAFMAYYVCQTHASDEKSANLYNGMKRMPWRWKFFVGFCVWLYLVILWAPLILDWNVPPIPPLDGSK